MTRNNLKFISTDMPFMWQQKAKHHCCNSNVKFAQNLLVAVSEQTKCQNVSLLSFEYCKLNFHGIHIKLSTYVHFFKRHLFFSNAVIFRIRVNTWIKCGNYSVESHVNVTPLEHAFWRWQLLTVLFSRVVLTQSPRIFSIHPTQACVAARSC